MTTSAAVSGPQPHGPQIEWAEAVTISLDWSDPSTMPAHAIGSKKISASLTYINFALRKKVLLRGVGLYHARPKARKDSRSR